MPSVDWQLFILPTITGVCTPACLLAASISVEAVTPPLVGLALQRTTSRLGFTGLEVKLLDALHKSRMRRLLGHGLLRRGSVRPPQKRRHHSERINETV